MLPTVCMCSNIRMFVLNPCAVNMLILLEVFCLFILCELYIIIRKKLKVETQFWVERRQEIDI